MKKMIDVSTIIFIVSVITAILAFISSKQDSNQKDRIEDLGKINKTLSENITNLSQLNNQIANHTNTAVRENKRLTDENIKLTEKANELIKGVELLSTLSHNLIDKLNSKAELEFSRLNSDIKEVRIIYTTVRPFPEVKKTAWGTIDRINYPTYGDPQKRAPEEAIPFLKNKIKDLVGTPAQYMYEHETYNGGRLVGDETVFYVDNASIVTKITDNDTIILRLEISSAPMILEKLKPTVYDNYLPGGETLTLGICKEPMRENQKNVEDIIAKNFDLLLIPKIDPNSPQFKVLYSEIDFEKKTIKQTIESNTQRDINNKKIKSVVDINQSYIYAYTSHELLNLTLYCGDDQADVLKVDSYKISARFDDFGTRTIYHLHH